MSGRPVAAGVALGSPVTEVALLAGGVALLGLGAEALVRGAGRLAVGFGLRASTVGVTVIAFATTSPELFVSLLGAATATTDIGLGAVIGSNVANIGLVLGVAALIRPLEVTDTVLRWHVPFMLLAALLLVAVGWSGQVGRLRGGLLLVALVGYVLVLLWRIRTTQADLAPGALADEPDPGLREVAFVGGGLVALLVGSRWLVRGGRSLLAAAGFSDLFIGLTVLALGTSLPELAASVVSALREESSFSVGNVVGSNIYNLLAVIGLLALVTPVSVSPDVRGFEFPALVVFTLLVVGLMARGNRLSRVDGGVLVAAYAAFVYLLLP